MTVRHQRYRARDGADRRHWIVDVEIELPDGTVVRKRKVSPVQTRRGAEQYERDLRAAILAGRAERKVPDAIPTLAQFSDRFIEGYAALSNKASELHTKRRLLELHLIPALGRRRLDEIGPAEIDAYKAAKVTGLASKTINNHLVLLHRVLVVAAEWGLLERGAIPACRLARVRQTERDFLDREEAHRLVEAAEPGWRVMVEVALHTGLRAGELLALRWRDVDLKAGRLVVRLNDWLGHVDTPKGGRQREVPLNATAAAALRSHRHLRGELVFCQDAGASLRYRQANYWLDRARAQAGIAKDCQWHTLRHTFAAWLVMGGVPLKAVADLLGHSTTYVTERYAHLSPGVTRDAVAVLDAPANARMEHEA